MKNTITIREFIAISIIAMVLFSIPAMGCIIYKQNQLIQKQKELIDKLIYK